MDPELFPGSGIIVPDPAKMGKSRSIKMLFLIYFKTCVVWNADCRTVVRNNKWPIPILGRFFFLIIGTPVVPTVRCFFF